MPQFKLFYDWQGSINLSVYITADNPEAAAKVLRKQAPGAIVHKTKLDKSDKMSERTLAKLQKPRMTVKHHKSELVSQLVEAGNLAGYKIFDNSKQSNLPDMIGSDGTAVTIVNGRSGTVIVDEYHFADGSKHVELVDPFMMTRIEAAHDEDETEAGAWDALHELYMKHGC